MEDGSIRIEEATEEALGTYTCVPYNTLGTMGQSAPARLVLKVRPGCGCLRVGRWAPEMPGVTAWPALLGPPVLHGATGLGVQAGGRPGAAHPLCRGWGPLSRHHLEKGTPGLWGCRERGGDPFPIITWRKVPLGSGARGGWGRVPFPSSPGERYPWAPGLQEHHGGTAGTAPFPRGSGGLWAEAQC